MSTPFTAHHVKAVVQPDGGLILDRLPFQAGQAVQVIIIPHDGDSAGFCSLRGMPVQYDRPFDPVAVDDWDAAQ